MLRTLTYSSFPIALLLPSLSATQDDDALEQCDHAIGTLAVVEPQSQTLHALSRYSLKSPTSLIRMMVQQSGGFLVVERGRAMANMRQERALASSGELQQDANVGGGQMKAADFILTPDVIFSEGNAGDVGGAVGGLLGRRLGEDDANDEAISRSLVSLNLAPLPVRRAVYWTCYITQVARYVSRVAKTVSTGEIERVRLPS